jgi:hypothetical protein
MSGIIIPYESREQYDRLFEVAKQKHLDMINTELLGFEARWAEYEIADLAHDTNWHQQSNAALMELTLNNNQAWCTNTTTMLSFLLTQCLFTTLLFVHQDIYEGNPKPMYKFPLVRQTAVNAIVNFFDDWINDEICSESFTCVNSDSDDTEFEFVPVAQVPDRKRKRSTYE